MQSSTSATTRAAQWFALALLLAHGTATEVSQQPLEQQEQQQVVTQDPAESPYLLVASSMEIYKMPTNGTRLRTQLSALVEESAIGALAFHYRRGEIYWINRGERCIKKADMNGSNVTALVMLGRPSNPADLAVDWIHDKLYWSDPGTNRIEEIDLETYERRVVIQLNSNSIPLGLAVFPTRDHGILYWADNFHHNLQRIITTGNSHAVVHQATGEQCVQPIALNLRQRMVYWGDACEFSIEAVSINGSNYEVVVNDGDAVRFPRGMSQFHDTVYWVQPTTVLKKTGGDMSVIYTGVSTQSLQDIQVVHPDTQPTIEQLQDTESVADIEAGCAEGCLNGGHCIFPGICDCLPGWGGLTCSEDENECLINNGGCTQNCINTDGGFHCSCHEGYTLSQDRSNCTESSIVPSSTPTNPPSPPPSAPSPILKPNVQPTVLAITPSDTAPSQPTKPTTADTDNVHPTRTSTHLPYKPSTTDTTEVVATATRNTSPTPKPVPTTPSTTPFTGDRETETEVTHGDGVVSTSSPSATEKGDLDILQTPLPTSDSKSGMTGHTDPTISGIDRANDDEGSNPLVFIIPVSVVAGFVVLSLAVFVFVMTYAHCKSHRQGSYSFANPTILDIAGEVSTNTLKRGQVTRTSFKQIGSTPNAAETVAILSQNRDSTRASSTISGSESFEWNNQ